MADEVITRAPGVLFERVDHETVVLDPATGDYTRLNATGTLLWELLSAPATAAALGERLVREYGIRPAAAREDVERFVVMLRERGLLTAPPPG